MTIDILNSLVSQNIPYDLLSTLVAAEVSITGTATATIGRMHVCSGTTADYTVTLPAATGNAGKLIGFRMAAALTKLVTLDGNASETINGALTRVFWAGESVILLCDGACWLRLSGTDRPHICSLQSLNSAQQIANASTFTQIQFDTTSSNALLNTPAYSATIRRAGLYNIVATYNIYSDNSQIVRALVQVYANGSGIAGKRGDLTRAVSTGYVQPSFLGPVSLSANDVLTLYAWVAPLSSTGTNNSLGSATALYITECSQWT